MKLGLGLSLTKVRKNRHGIGGVGGLANWFDAPQYDLMAAGADFNNDRYFMPPLGADIVQNGDFADGTGWSAANANREYVNGTLRLISDGTTAFPQSYQVGIPIVVGRLYKFTAMAKRGSSSANVWVTCASINLIFTNTFYEVKEGYFIGKNPSTETVTCMLSGNPAGAGDGFVDWVKVEEVIIDRTGKTLGSEMVINGDMSSPIVTDATLGWKDSSTAGSTASILGGTLTLTPLSSSGSVDVAIADQHLSGLEVGAQYELVLTSTAGFSIQMGTSAGGVDTLDWSSTTSGAQTRRFTANVTNPWIRFIRNYTATATSIDNVSIKKITAVGTKYAKRSATFDEFFSFTASSGIARTWVDNTNVIRNANYDQNFVRASPFVAVSGWNITNITGNYASDTGVICTRLTDNATSGVHGADCFSTGMHKPVNNGDVFTVSFEAKAETATVIKARAGGPFGASAYVNLNLIDGTYVSGVDASNVGTTNLGNGWWRCVFNVTISNNVLDIYFVFRMLNNDVNGSETYTGTGQSVLVRRPQIRRGNSYKPYIIGNNAADGVNVPRFDWRNGKKQLRLEDQRVNLLLKSQDFSDGATWVNFGPTTYNGSLTVALDGTTSALEQLEDGSAKVIRTQSVTKAASATTYTASLFVKPRGRQYIFFGFDSGNAANRCSVQFDLSGVGAIVGTPSAIGTFTGASATIRAYANGWYRISVIGTTDASTSARVVIISGTGVDTNGASPTPTPINGVAFEVWGAQLETGTFVSDYIPTTTGQITRATDNAQLSSLVDTILRLYQGSIVVRLDLDDKLENECILGIGNKAFLHAGSPSNWIQSYGATELIHNSGASNDLPMGVAVSYDDTSSARTLVHDGVAVTRADGRGTLTANSALGRAPGGGSTTAFGNFDFIGIAPERVSDTQLQTWGVAA